MNDFIYIKRANGNGAGFNWSHVVYVTYYPGGVDEIGEDGPPGQIWPPKTIVSFVDGDAITYYGVEAETIIEEYQRRAACYTLPTD